MDLYLVNESKDATLTPAVVTQIAAAVQRQLIEHWAPCYERIPPSLRVVAAEADVPAGAPMMVILDNADEAGVLGYHTMTPEGRIYSPVFWEPIQVYGGTVDKGADSLSVTISHEAIELANDPTCNMLCDRPDAGEEWYEPCDRVEGRSYEIDGVSVSDFLTPKAFRDGPGPYTYMARAGLAEDLTERGEVAPAGYVDIREGGPGGAVRAVFGDKMPSYKRAQRESPHAASRCARRRAAA